jgi:hypothetical protein
MNDDGHFIDDPLTVVGAKPDFSGMGIPPEHRYEKTPMSENFRTEAGETEG